MAHNHALIHLKASLKENLLALRRKLFNNLLRGANLNVLDENIIDS
jgi:hypothetical protein